MTRMLFPLWVSYSAYIILYPLCLLEDKRTYSAPVYNRRHGSFPKVTYHPLMKNGNWNPPINGYNDINEYKFMWMEVWTGKSSINGGFSIPVAMFDVSFPNGTHTTWFFQLTSVGGQVGIPSAAFPEARKRSGREFGSPQQKMAVRDWIGCIWPMVRIHPHIPRSSDVWWLSFQPIVARSGWGWSVMQIKRKPKLDVVAKSQQHRHWSGISNFKRQGQLAAVPCEEQVLVRSCWLSFTASAKYDWFKAADMLVFGVFGYPVVVPAF